MPDSSMSLSETSVRGAVIVVEQLPNGYWSGRVSIRVPQLAGSHEQRCDSFHNVVDALDWARGAIELLTRSV